MILPSPPQAAQYFNTSRIQSLDPLKADAELARLPELNRQQDAAALVQLLQGLASRARDLVLEDAESAFAAMRDIGIVAGSLKRHGVEPLQAVPDAERPMLEIGHLTGMVPRDTVHHYTSWNPDGERRRTYTDDPQERWLQDAVTHVFPKLSASLAISDALSAMEPGDIRFSPSVSMLCQSSQAMVESIDSVTSRVSPVFFAQTMRPYYEAILVDGVSYLGPAAAQAPLWLIDLCVWASDRNQPDYLAFLLESLQYSLPEWRQFYARHCDQPSLVSRIADLLQRDPANEGTIAAAGSIADLLYILKVFRGRHIGIARRAYADEVRLFDKGSGGAPVALLKSILDLTRENEALMQVRPRGKPAPASARTQQKEPA